MEEIAVEHESTRLGAPFANVLTPTAVQLPMLQDVSMLIGKETGNLVKKNEKKKKKIGTPFLLSLLQFAKFRFCDDGNNNPECDYDGGDCCGYNVKRDYCQFCQCLDPAKRRCYFKWWKGNGRCDDKANNPECNYDGGKFEMITK